MQKYTQKIYYDYPFLSQIEAKVIDIKDDSIVLDKTISYPEGGGQEGDRGVFVLENGKEIKFLDTQKGLGRVVFLENFPTIQVETPIYHKVDSKYIDEFKIGVELLVKIDIERRYRLSASHSATHLMLMGIEKFYGKYEDKVYGCYISPNKGRLDFRTLEKFTRDKLLEVEKYVNDLIRRDLEIKTYPHKDEKEALYWECDEVVYPCGGTHLLSSGAIGEIKIKRKNLGKNGQRSYFEMNNLKLNLECYHK